jgi:hypothetical protein
MSSRLLYTKATHIAADVTCRQLVNWLKASCASYTKTHPSIGEKMYLTLKGKYYILEYGDFSTPDVVWTR